MKVHDTASWPLERIAPYYPDIIKAFRGLANRFPRDVTVESLWAEYLLKRKRLWLVLDGERFVACAMSCITEAPATGLKRATLCDLSGEWSDDYADELREMTEAWAKESGADVPQIEGRPGWSRWLRKHGYEPHTVIYRKVR